MRSFLRRCCWHVNTSSYSTYLDLQQLRPPTYSLVQRFLVAFIRLGSEGIVVGLFKNVIKVRYTLSSNLIIPHSELYQTPFYFGIYFTASRNAAYRKPLNCKPPHPLPTAEDGPRAIYSSHSRPTETSHPLPRTKEFMGIYCRTIDVFSFENNKHVKWDPFSTVPVLFALCQWTAVNSWCDARKLLDRKLGPSADWSILLRQSCLTSLTNLKTLLILVLS